MCDAGAHVAYIVRVGMFRKGWRTHDTVKSEILYLPRTTVRYSRPFVPLPNSEKLRPTQLEEWSVLQIPQKLKSKPGISLAKPGSTSKAPSQPHISLPQLFREDLIIRLFLPHGLRYPAGREIFWAITIVFPRTGSSASSVRSGRSSSSMSDGQVNTLMAGISLRLVCVSTVAVRGVASRRERVVAVGQPFMSVPNALTDEGERKVIIRGYLQSGEEEKDMSWGVPGFMSVVYEIRVSVKPDESAGPDAPTWEFYAAKFGHTYLAKHGWAPGAGLGVTGDGRVSHIAVAQKLDQLGIGAGRPDGPDSIAWKQAKEFEESGGSALSTPSISTPESTPVGTPAPRRLAHRARFLAAKRLAGTSSTALSEILGVSSTPTSTSESTPIPSTPATPGPGLTEIPVLDDSNQITTSSQSVADYFKNKMREKAQAAGGATTTSTAVVTFEEPDTDSAPHTGLEARRQDQDEGLVERPNGLGFKNASAGLGFTNASTGLGFTRTTSPLSTPSTLTPKSHISTPDDAEPIKSDKETRREIKRKRKEQAVTSDVPAAEANEEERKAAKRARKEAKRAARQQRQENEAVAADDLDRSSKKKQKVKGDKGVD
ncbi:hypothetical protein FRC11_001605 [Ceratobasidium sp. 423]|nr:hypothetical protein FRC11_001605 [Ceratobasidium sp. 423]